MVLDDDLRMGLFEKVKGVSADINKMETTILFDNVAAGFQNSFDLEVMHFKVMLTTLATVLIECDKYLSDVNRGKVIGIFNEISSLASINMQLYPDSNHGVVFMGEISGTNYSGKPLSEVFDLIKG